MSFSKTFSYCRSKLDNLKELQNLRKRPNGISIVGLALGKKVSVEEEAVLVCIIIKICFRNIKILFTI